MCVDFMCTCSVSKMFKYLLASLADQAPTPFQRMFLTLGEYEKKGTEAKEEFM